MPADNVLLEEAKPYCDPATGEVRTRMPEELMQRLRHAKLALGIGGRRNQQTESTATWFVFFNEDIRQQVLDRYRVARRERRKARGSRKGPQRTAEDQPSTEKPPAQRGLGQFRRRRQSS